jgi:hypothetical protein
MKYFIYLDKLVQGVVYSSASLWHDFADGGFWDPKKKLQTFEKSLLWLNNEVSFPILTW